MEYLTEAPLDVAALLAEVTRPERGGAVVFLGSVRRGPDDGPVAEIDYSAYAAMVAAECERILDEARQRWGDAVVLIQHRVGRVPVGEPSVAVVAAAPHREAAFAACRFAIEELKRRVPIWKRELMDDGTAVWR